MKHERTGRLSDRRVLGPGLIMVLGWLTSAASAQPAPTLMDPNLAVRTAVSGLNAPTSISFLGPDDFLVLEKNTGRVVRVTNGVTQGAVLDLGVNFASERGLLGIALHPDFPSTPQVFLFWTTRSTGPPSDPFVPEERVGLPANMFAPDTDEILTVPLLGNRVDRFTWDGTSLTFDRNLIHLRAFQNDAAPDPPGQGDQEQPPRGNHNGGILAFGPDGKLYVYFGDQGRRGQLQNLPSGPTPTGLGPTMPDDQFGGPEPDDAHLAGVILRLETDGSAPTDNPFFEAGAAMGGEVGANIQKIFAYGLRNSFGMAFDPLSGLLWEADHGEDAFDEINRVDPGMNGGWIQVQGPLRRIDEYRGIETTSLHNEDFPNLQQLRWGPERIAERAAEARKRLFQLPGASYVDPELSFKHVLPPAGLGFVRGDALGEEHEGAMFWGMAGEDVLGGALFRAQLDRRRMGLEVVDRRLRDRVVDNLTFLDTTEAESLLVGQNFGVVTDLETGPDGNLYAVSLSHGAVYEISRAPGARSATGRHAPGTRKEGVWAAAPTGRGEPGAIHVATSRPSEIEVAIYDIAGRRVVTLERGRVDSGSRVLRWNGRDDAGRTVGAGIYFVRLRLAGESGAPVEHTGKMLVVR
jgi:glucose/arabinose dehydrogenase